ncbi:MAG: aspartate aminotransferase family protein [Caldilinea sp.]
MIEALLDHATLVEHDRRHLHPLHHPAQLVNPLVVERAEGVWIYTTDGRRVLDGMAGLWNVNIGYGNQELPEVAAAQMRKLAYTSNYAGMTTPPAAELAYRMAGMAHPSLNTTFFTSGGSEANDSAFKTVRYYWHRRGQPEKFKIISRQAGYHGITMAATAATGIPRYHTMFGPLAAGFSHIPTPNPYRYTGDLQPGETVGQAAARALEEEILRQGPETVAAFIVEPIQGVGGVIVPPDDYFPLVQALCDRYAVLLIVDEVICGFGRTGLWFGEHHWHLRPDILTFAKGITSGYLPLGGMQISDAIRETIDSAQPQESWMHGFTYSGHATACAVGLKTIEILERENLLANSQQMGERLKTGLHKLLEFPIVGEVRGRGLLCGVEIVKDKESREADVPKALAIYNACLARGLRLRNVGATLACSPPLVIDAEEVDQIVDILGSVIDSVC